MKNLQKQNFFKTFENAFTGIFLVIKKERNFQIEIFALFVNIFLIYYFELNAAETSIILIVCFVVLVAEMLNTALEKMADFVEPNFNSKIGIIKDIAAGAVLMAAIGAVIIGIIIYQHYIMEFF
ncbi:diacylglycerol kinase family protein [Frigoriflavimonas asaccharolytica]|uniref:Diacylglycerol kinase (ATP) n=1 Tax=Frigoriflavimonas asaccharolytica TaxID=2735899 RepID=A0A8J8KAN5_9FLAO|nr:diacylglycerol kinase family protein [Frigoriflavimonas asaccharolytica]NRS91669.1 diacylglycerol kinase (ATP) [Frigoriflavimonas asaccharolytica]